MAMRINGAKNFKGQSYATEDYANGLISAMKQSGKSVLLDTLLGTKGKENEIAMYDADGVFKSTGYSIGITTIEGNNYGIENKFATEAGTKAYIDDAISTVSAAAISVSGSNGITVTGDSTAKTIGNTFKIVKKASANSGFAASYQLMYVTGGAGTDESPYTYGVLNNSDDINIVKDQFLKSGSLVWGTAPGLGDGGSITGESATKTEVAIYPFVKLVVYTNENGNSLDDASTSTIYIPANDLFRDYTAATGAKEIQLSINNSNEISADVVKIDSTKIGYKEAEGDIGGENYKAAISVKTALDDLYTQIGSNGSVATQITTAIEALDVTDTAVEGNYVSAVAETDGKVVVSRETLPVANVAFDTSTLKLTTADGAKQSTEVADLTPFKTAIEKAVQIVETEYTLSEGSANVTITDNGVPEAPNKTVTVTNVSGRVIAVYDALGKQVYPDIEYVSQKDGVSAYSKLTAEYGASEIDAKWTVIHTATITVSFS